MAAEYPLPRVIPREAAALIFTTARRAAASSPQIAALRRAGRREEAPARDGRSRQVDFLALAPAMMVAETTPVMVTTALTDTVSGRMTRKGGIPWEESEW